MDIRTDGPYPAPPGIGGGVRPMIENRRPGKLFRPGPGRPGLARLRPIFSSAVVDVGDMNLGGSPVASKPLVVGQSITNATTY